MGRATVGGPWLRTGVGLAALACMASAGGARASTPPAPATLTGRAAAPAGEMVWWYRRPAAKFWEGLPIGTGRLAGMVLGGVRQERVHLNDETLFAGGPYDPNPPGGPRALAAVRELLFAGKCAEAHRRSWALFGRPVLTQPYQPLGWLEVDFDGHNAVADYRRELDMDAGTASVSYRIGGARYSREAFASFPDQVAVLRVACDRPGRVSLTAGLRTPHAGAKAEAVSACEVALRGRAAPAETHPQREARRAVALGLIDPDLQSLGLAAPRPAHIDSRSRWQAQFRAVAAGGRTRSLKAEDGRPLVRVEGADAVTFVVAAATNYKCWNDVSADPDARCREYMRAADMPYDKLLDRHLADHRPRFRACRLRLGHSDAGREDTTTRLQALRDGGHDAHFIAQYFQYGRYLLLAAARPCTLAFNNHNIWYDGVGANWQGRWTLNINLQECYWPVETTSLAELNDSLLGFTQQLAEAGRRTAKELYGCGGWVAHHGTDGWMSTAPTSGPVWGM